MEADDECRREATGQRVNAKVACSVSGPKPAGSPAARFRREIDLAFKEGAEPQDLRLRLTLSDASRLMRDPEVAVSDIRFEAGVMRFLGVEVQKGGIEASTLEMVDTAP